MNATVVVLLVCSLVALAAACCTPEQWEGKQTIIVMDAEGSSHVIAQVYKDMSYDAINNRSVIIESIRQESATAKLKRLTRYDNSSSGKQYILDYDLDRCDIYDLKTPFDRLCLAAYDKPVEQFFLGFSGALNATWYKILNGGVQNFLSVEELGKDVCIPVVQVIYGRERQEYFVETVIYSNITRGIKNTTVFDIPEQCKNVEPSLDEPPKRHHFIRAI